MIKNSSYKISSIFLFLYSAYIINETLDTSLLDISFFNKIFKWILLGILGFLYIYENIYFRIPLSRFLIEIAVLFLFGISAYKSNRMGIFMNAVFIISAGKTNFRNLCKVHLFSMLSSLFIIFLLIVFGFVEDVVLPNGGHCFGFGYFHNVPYRLFFCLLDYIYLKNKEMSFPEVILLITCNVILWKYTTVDLIFYLVFILIILYYIIKKYPLIKIDSPGIQKLAALIYPFGLLVSSFFMIYYDPSNDLWVTLNRFSSGRIRLMQVAYFRYPITLFGQRIETNAAINRIGDYFYIDSGFIYSLLGYGIVTTVFVVLLYSILSVYSCKKNDKILFIWLILVMLFTVSNNIWFNVTYSPLLLLSIKAYNELKVSRVSYKSNRSIVYI